MTEAGANSEWIPGCFTPIGNSEAVNNAVDRTMLYKHI